MVLYAKDNQGSQAWVAKIQTTHVVTAETWAWRSQTRRTHLQLWPAGGATAQLHCSSRCGFLAGFALSFCLSVLFHSASFVFYCCIDLSLPSFLPVSLPSFFLPSYPLSSILQLLNVSCGTAISKWLSEHCKSKAMLPIARKQGILASRSSPSVWPLVTPML